MSRPISQPELQTIHDVIVELAQRAGERIVSAIDKKRPDIQSKLNSVDLVTQSDKDTESLISNELKRTFPKYAFMGEETAEAESVNENGGGIFIVDPIDGTTNFIHGFPYFSISIGFCYHGTPMVGVVYNPVRRDLYSGIRGKGAWKNSMPIMQTAHPLGTLNDSLVILEWGAERANRNFQIKKEMFCAFAERARSVRSLGSAALNLCALAEGVCDVYWEGGVHSWDVCGAWPILLEAGGRILHGNTDSEARVDDRVYLAVRGGPNPAPLVQEIRTVLGHRKLEYD